MPPFMTGPFALNPRRGITAGLPAYAAGSFPFGQQDVRLAVTSVAVAAAVATLGVKYLEGTLPLIAGQLISVRGTSVGGPNVNISNLPFTSSAIVPATGLGTIVFTAPGAPNLSTTPDSGLIFVPVQEVGEALAVGKLQQFALDAAGGYGLTLVWSTPSAPGTIALQLEGAINDNDAEYAILGTSQTALNGQLIASVPENVRFVRVNVTAATGGSSPTLIAKIYQSTSMGL